MSARLERIARGRRMPLLIALAVLVSVTLAVTIDATPRGNSEPNLSGGEAVETRSSAPSSGRDDSVAGSEQYGFAEPASKEVAATPALVDGDVAERAADSAGAVGGEAITASGANVDLGLKVLQTGSMTVTYRKGRLDEGYAHVTRVARSLGGYVVSSSRSSADSDGSRESALITIRVPNGRFQGAVERIGEGGKVTQLDISSQDVTQEYVDSKSRLRHDQAVEARLLRLLGQADSVADALVVQDRLAALQQQIEVEKGRIAYLDKLTALGTIEVTLRERGAAAKNDTGAEWGVNDAVADAAHNAVDNVNAAIVWLGGALPGLVLLAMVLAVGRTGVRRWRRDARYTEQRGSVARATETSD